jgi:hypothetical protein
MIVSLGAVLIVTLLASGIDSINHEVSSRGINVRDVASSHLWYEPIKVYHQVAAGFNPFTATNTQLLANGLPPRPPGSNPGATATWETAIKHAKHYSAPDPIPSSTYHTLEYSGNWAGHIVPNSDYGNVHFIWSESSWTQPAVSGNSNYTNYQDAPDASFWTGIGVTSLIQAGADSISTSTPQYRFWTEDYPEASVWEGPIIRPGDTAFVEVYYNGNNTSYYFLENESTNSYQSFTNSSPDLGWRAANFINERVNGLYLPNFGSTNIYGNYFGDTSNSYQLTPTNNIMFMTSNCQSTGALLSDPSGVDGSGDFSQNWKSSSPYCNS